MAITVYFIPYSSPPPKPLYHVVTIYLSLFVIYLSFTISFVFQREAKALNIISKHKLTNIKIKTYWLEFMSGLSLCNLPHDTKMTI